MDYPPDYSKYTLDKLLYVDQHINREQYPKSARRLDQEIAGRRREVSERKQHLPLLKSIDNAKEQPPQIQEHSSELSLEFHGSAREYFRIWIVNLCLTLLTLGFFSAWAKVRKKRFSYSHTTIGGTPFQYLGQPIPILKGRLIAGIGFLVYYISSHFITSLLPWVLGAGIILAPWVIVRSAAFNAGYSAFRNMTFHFEAGYMDAFKVLYAWGIIPILVMGMMFKWLVDPTFLGIISIVFAFSLPWLIRRVKKFIVEHTFYGGKNGVFSASGGQYFKIYFISGLIMLGVTIPLGILVAIVTTSTTKMWLLTYISPILVYAGYVLAYAYIRARSGNLAWNNTRLGPLRFQSTLRCRDLVRLYVTNALGIVASSGLLIPWAVIRTWKYRADNMRVWQEEELTQFQGSHTSKVTALGAETLDIFDLDLSL
ncbi:Thymidylate kinase (EC [Olavius sp. associated proteobacterium Delta 1]|nr:Thymidylate kinase (EC [Olavius sp. associated proteobacterium Delta 1]